MTSYKEERKNTFSPNSTAPSWGVSVVTSVISGFQVDRTYIPSEKNVRQTKLLQGSKSQYGFDAPDMIIPTFF